MFSLVTLSLVLAADPKLGEEINKLIPRATGVALVEVLDTKETDQRPVDGNHFVNVRFRIVESSGKVRDSAMVIKAWGGFRAGAAPKLDGPIKPDTFQKGQRYWVAFASPEDFKQYPHGLVNAWPEKDAPKIIPEAAKANHFKP